MQLGDSGPPGREPRPLRGATQAPGSIPGGRCRCPGGDRPTIAATVLRLKGIQMLSHSPKCLVINRRTCPPSSEAANRETGLVKVPWRVRKVASVPGAGEVDFPPADLQKFSIRRCALVGNGPSLANSQDGRVIDRFDAVFRFNSITNKDPVKGREAHVGSKTTFRMFNRVTSLEIAEGLYQLSPAPGETWIFWHRNTRPILGVIQKRYPKVRLLLLSAAQVNWQLQVYFQLRQDLRSLGFGPFDCPSNLNTGMHAILMATHLCQQVGTFGISHTVEGSQGRFSSDNHTTSRFHSWDFDSLLVRLLHYASKIDVCNA